MTLNRRGFLRLTGGMAAASALVACRSGGKETARAASVLTPTPTPTASAPHVTFNVRDLGAKADGTTDDSAAINATVQKAIAAGPGATVVVPAGRYRLATAGQSFGRSIYTNAESGIDLAKVGYAIKAHVIVEHASGLTIAGEPGTLFAMADSTASGVWLERCTNTVMTQIAIDYDPLPFTQGVVTAVNGTDRSFEWNVDSGYLDPTQGYLGQALTTEANRGLGFGNLFTSDGTLKFGSFYGGDATLTAMTALGGGRFRTQGLQPPGDLAVGDRFGWPARIQTGGHAVALSLCDSCRLEALTVYSAPQLSFLANDCDQLTVSNCTIQPLPNSGRLYASNADGVHAKSHRRGPLIEGCNFTHHGDDSVTVVQQAQQLFGMASPTELLVELTQYQLFLPGDHIAIIAQTTGLTRTEAVVQDVTLVKYRNRIARKVALDRPVAGLVSVDSLGLPSIPAPVAGHDRTTPLAQRPDLIADMDLVGSGFVLRNNVFTDHRASGMRIYSTNGLVEGNRFERLAGYGLQIGIELAWPEVYHAKTVTIRNNTFRGISNVANIWLHSLLGNYAQAQGMNNEDITIDGNTFADYGARLGGLPLGAVTVSNGQNVRITNNQFSPDASFTVVPEAIHLDLASDVVVQGNTITQRGGGPDPVTFTPRADRASITVSGNQTP